MRYPARMKTFSYAIALLLSAAFLPSCGGVLGTDPTGCTEIGCNDQLDIELGPIGNKFASSLPLSITVCIDDKGCEGFVVEAAGGLLTCRTDGGETLGSCSLDDKNNVTLSPGIGVGGGLAAGDHAVELTVKDKDGMVLVVGSGTAVLKETRPNGPDCEPVCVQGGVTFPP